PRPCIHYIWSPTVHRTWKCNYFSKYKLLNVFFHQQLEQSCDFHQCQVEHWLKLVEVFILLSLSYETAEPLALCLDSADWPCADHMHSPKKQKHSSHTHQTEHVESIS
ncbi:unnamed protein product, partial [Staurois parvus]